MICHKSEFSSFKLTVEKMKEKLVVILPTDTVYGFSAIVDDDSHTKEKIQKIKGRDDNKPFIQLISSADEIKKFTDTEIPQELLKYWPGPLTIIVEDKRYSTENNKVTTAFRCPGDEWLRNVIKECGVPVYSTSVNRTGCTVLTKEIEIVEEFEKETGLIVLDGDSKNSVPSTIVKIEKNGYSVVRKGAVDL